MRYFKIYLTYLPGLLFYLSVHAQQITYAEPQREDTRQMRFEIIGKFDDNYLVYKNSRNDHYINVYDHDMKVKENVRMDYVPDRIINTDFIAYNDYSVLIYQYQKRNVVHCVGVKLDKMGKKMADPVDLDTTEVSVFGDNKIYSTIFSDDKSKIMIFKIKGKNKDNLHFATLLFDNQLNLVHTSRFNYDINEPRDVLTDFYLDNDGNFLFCHGERDGAREYINKATLIEKRAREDGLFTVQMKFKDIFLDEIRIKVDNFNNRYILTSYYSKSKKGNIDGIYTAIYEKDLQEDPLVNSIEFDDDFRLKAKSDNSNKTAFNDYFLKHFIIKKDGGFIVTGESTYSSSRGNTWNRWDYLYPYSYWSPYNYYYYSPWNNWGYSSYYWNRYGGYQSTRFYADNIMVLAIDRSGKLQWENVVSKSQYDDESDNRISYSIMNTGAEVIFLYNEWQRRNLLLSSQVLEPGGKIDRRPPLRSLDRGYEFMIRFGKQVSANQMIVPVMYRNNFSFARIDF